MRRRREISEREPPKTRISSFGRFSGVRNHEEHQDSIREKRVKFADPQIYGSQFMNPHYIRSSASPEKQRAGASASNAPKTSEYAFFKKLRNSSSHDLSNRSHKEKKQSKNLEPEESNNTLKCSYPDLRSSRLVEKVRENLFLSPQANSSKNSVNSRDVEVTNILRDGYEESRFPLVTDTGRPIKCIPRRSSPGGKLPDVGTTYLDEDFFSGKRKKLRQWAVQTMMPEVYSSRSERCDLVSLLLNRLFPNIEENISSRNAKPMQTIEESSKWIHSSPESDAVCEEFHSKYKKNFTEAGNEWCRKDKCKVSREMIHPKLDTEDFDSPLTSNSAEYFQYQDKTSFPAYEKMQTREDSSKLERTPINYSFQSFTREDSDKLIRSSPESDAVCEELHSKHKRNFTEAGNEWCGKDKCKVSREMIHPEMDADVFDSPLTSYSAEYHDKTSIPAYEDNTTSFIAVRDPLLIDFEQYGHAPSYIQELNEFQVLNESTSKGGPINLSSNWDVDSLDKRCKSFFTSNKMNLHTWTASEDNNNKSLSDGFDVGEPYTSSLFSSYSFRVSSFSLPYSYVPNNSDEERSLEERSLTAELEYVPLSLSCIPQYRSTWEDFTHRLYEDISIFSPENNRWLINKTFNDKHPSDFGVLVPSGLGSEFGLKCLPASESCDKLHSATYDALLPLQNDGSCLKLLTDGQEEFLHCSSNREIVAYVTGDADNCHEWSSVDFHRPLDMVHCPLLLGSSSWQRFEEDAQFDDD